MNNDKNDGCSICEGTGTTFGKVCVCRVETDTKRATLTNALRQAALDLLDHDRQPGACIEIDGEPPLYVLVGAASALGKLLPEAAAPSSTEASAQAACTYPNCACIGGGVFKPCVKASAQAAPTANAERVDTLVFAKVLGNLLCADRKRVAQGASVDPEWLVAKGALIAHIESLIAARVAGIQAAPDAVRDAVRWQFMMRVADNDQGPEALAVARFGNEPMEDDRPESEQMNEMVDKAIDFLRTQPPADSQNGDQHG